MAWFFIIVGILFLVFASVAMLFLYINNPINKLKWERRVNNHRLRRENKQKLREVKKKYKELKIEEEIIEKSRAIKQKEKELKGISERDLQRIQQQGLSYIDKDNK